MSAYSHLTASWTLAGFPLRNRLIFSAMSTVAPQAGAVSDRLMRLTASRAEGGAAMVVTEALLSHRAQRGATRVRAWDEANLEGLKRWADAVEAHDSRLVGQLYDPGRGHHYPGRSELAIGPSARPDDLSWSIPRALTRHEIASLIAELAETAHRLQRAGFSGVELSCGHGHLFHQFLSPQANRRDDEYGGTTEGRTRFIREICAAVRDACGDHFILGLKLAGRDGVEGGVNEDEAERILPYLLADRRVSYVAFVQGAHHRSLEMHMPDRSYPSLPARDLLTRLRPFAGDTPIIAVARITTPTEAEDMLASGECDAVMLGRSLIADAAWLNKAVMEREQDIRLCLSCNSCWGMITDLRPIGCDVNPRLGMADEAQYTPPRTESPKRIAIVGAGLAGLEAAWVAARRGHTVTVFGASPKPGGAMRTNAEIPGCEQLARSYDYQVRQARDAGVTFKLGTEADVQTIAALAPDTVVLATGAAMFRPDALAAIPEALDLRSAVRELLTNPAHRSGTAVLFDMDHTAGTYDALEFFARCFDRAVLITPRESIASDTPLVVRHRVQARIYGKRIPVMTFSEVVGLHQSALTVRHVLSGDESEITGVTLLAYSTPRIPRDELSAELRALGMNVTRIGDCLTPRATMAAVQEGHDAALAC